MSSYPFRIDEHTLECQHIRGYHRATAHSQEEVLHLAIKQYTPLNNTDPKPGDLTIIGAHANGFPKELYEPLWEEMLHRSAVSGVRIRSIWIADVAQQGASGVLNEGKLGNDPSWMDHPRDLLHMINTFRAQMPMPLVGVGHSMGGNNLVNLSLMHPRLFETLILIDPVIQLGTSPLGNFAPAVASSRRRDRWPSRAAAAEAFSRSKFYQSWDPRVLERWIQHGLRELPTKLYPSPSTPGGPSRSTAAAPEVTLSTTKHQEVFTFLRPNFRTDISPSNPQAPDLIVSPDGRQDRETHPDFDLRSDRNYSFYRPEPISTFHQLPFLRPSVLYVFGETSYLSNPDFRRGKMEVTGTGVGGSGGAKEGRVKEVVVEGVGHLIPMEAVRKTAVLGTEWIAAEMTRYRAREDRMKKEWEAVPDNGKGRLSEAYLTVLQGAGMGLGKEDTKGGKAKL
ncbi:hypothetical protein K490DRAFT_38616 [Saccharata proteae CBS 121410]|uniref:Serine aminopeptidase S33 domain-containing protein n=1 Tax=Saccharata proteae CBS 121410 TaxID=1314787 RepID=A0A6A5YBK0_9PEZI|nr:hypothetical protein K490DRAFT_38616 [Saccharata proteae CBS 121410]